MESLDTFLTVRDLPATPQLATTYESFNIVHAIIQLRKICNKQGKNPAISSVIGNKRLQFIPLQWRSSLQFDEMTEDDGDLDAELDNRFSINDIQVEGGELLFTIRLSA